MATPLRFNGLRDTLIISCIYWWAMATFSLMTWPINWDCHLWEPSLGIPAFRWVSASNTVFSMTLHYTSNVFLRDVLPVTIFVILLGIRQSLQVKLVSSHPHHLDSACELTANTAGVWRFDFWAFSFFHLNDLLPLFVPLLIWTVALLLDTCKLPWMPHFVRLGRGDIMD